MSPEEIDRILDEKLFKIIKDPETTLRFIASSELVRSTISYLRQRGAEPSDFLVVAMNLIAIVAEFEDTTDPGFPKLQSMLRRFTKSLPTYVQIARSLNDTGQSDQDAE